MADKKMTSRDFLKAVAENKITDAIQQYAIDAILKLDETNAKRKAAPKKPSKASVENLPIVRDITSFFSAKAENTLCLAKDIAAAIGQTVQKTSAVLSLMADDGAIIKVVPENRNKPIEYRLSIPYMGEASDTATDDGI